CVSVEGLAGRIARLGPVVWLGGEELRGILAGDAVAVDEPVDTVIALERTVSRAALAVDALGRDRAGTMLSVQDRHRFDLSGDFLDLLGREHFHLLAGLACV